MRIVYSTAVTQPIIVPDVFFTLPSIELTLGTCCGDFQEPWRAWFGKLGNPAAFLGTCSDAEYQAYVGRKTRNMLRKAERHFYYTRFSQPNFLREIEDINWSRPTRQGIAMTNAYKSPPIADTHVNACTRHQKIWLGGFQHETERLMAYAQIVTFQDFAILNKIIGHGDAFAGGVMNGLVRCINEYCDRHGWKYVNYLTMPSKTKNLEAFKRHSGFRPMHWTLA